MSLMVPAANVLAQGQAGTTLSSTVTANAIYETRHSWIIEKTADPTDVGLYPGESVNVTYTVSVSKGRPTYSYYIEGEVCVTNGGERATENLEVRLDLYHHRGGANPWVYIGSYPVDVSRKPVLGPGEYHCYSYRIDIPEYYWGEVKFKVDSKVTITNHSGRLGIPYGPSSDATTERAYRTLYDCVTVVDTHAPEREWKTCESRTWTYYVTLNYDASKADRTEVLENTARIVETGQSDTATVTVTYYEVLTVATISGLVFWDNNYNGVYDAGDKTVPGAAVNLYRYDEGTDSWIYVDTATSDEIGYFFEVEPGYTYRVEVSVPGRSSCDRVLNTTPTYHEIGVEGVGAYGGNDFGFVCLKVLTGAYSKGYWSWSVYNKKAGRWQTRVTTEDLSYINGELGTSFGTPKELADYLTSPVYGDMSAILRQQLIATLLNLRYGYVSGDTVLHYDGEYTTIAEAVGRAKDALTSGTRSEQEHLKDLLDAVNNNRVYMVYVI